MTRLVFDIGGTHFRLAAAENGELKDVRVVPTPAEPAEAASIFRTFMEEQPALPERAVGGIAGRVENGRFLQGPNLPRWSGFDLAATLPIPLALYNDADVGALGEAIAGAGKGADTVAYLTLGTGVGGALVRGRTLVPGLEPGHQILDWARGLELEDMAGGAALSRTYGAAPETLPRAAYDERTPALASALYNIVRLWAPDIIVMNGSLMNDANGFRLADVRTAFETRMGRRSAPRLVSAAWGDRSGLVGAALVDV
jgi:predicted NBD/HSP70 family sugar kinase